MYDSATIPVIAMDAVDSYVDTSYSALFFGTITVQHTKLHKVAYIPLINTQFYIIYFIENKIK